MSAQIPETMLLSDLLKATGYDCPEELQGLTFAEATVGESEVQTKSVTITTNTSTEVKPDKGKLLSKVTVVTAVPVPTLETKTQSITANGEMTLTPDEGKAYSSVVLNVAVPATKLFAFGTAEGVVYTLSVPDADTASIDVYVPATTGLTKTTGAYVKEANKVTVSATDYARYDTGDVQF